MDTDYIGFSYAGVHYAPGGDIVLYRTSNNGRYQDQLLPSGADKTQVIEGNDGTYYWSTEFNQKQFTIDFAFEGLTGAEVRQMKQNFAKRNSVFPLIFDEQPYKTWMVKCIGIPYINAVCFDDVDQSDENSSANIYHNHVLSGATHTDPTTSDTSSTNRIYKGEGQVSFVAYYPFAKSTHKWLNSYSNMDTSGWAEESGLKQSKGSYDGTGSSVTLYNAGDMPTNFKIRFNINDVKNGTSSFKLTGSTSSDVYFIGQISVFVPKSGDSYLEYDSRTQMAYGLTSGLIKSGNLYNRYLTFTGDKIKIPFEEESTITTTNIANGVLNIEYDYLYY